MHNFTVLLNNLDRNILNNIQQYLKNPFLDNIMPFITALGDAGIIWILISIILISTKKYRKAGIVCALSLAINAVLGEVVIKNVIQRARPFIHDPSLDLLIAKPKTFSFPSGHTASSFAAAAALSVYLKRYSIIFWVLAVLIAFSRLYLYVHFPSDVAGGILLGLISFKLADWTYKKFIKKRSDDI
ncbi:phosphatase PAP2 family protein [Clostridium polynesiense]|uniref:phosphatase PAP2 family protein n=1 Tax=Clostridium polynesiense TaxID=1325933 RepID=UPI00058BE410|nr:phosphatase PAP2 family protein [Clostridium polynesiense]